MPRGLKRLRSRFGSVASPSCDVSMFPGSLRGERAENVRVPELRQVEMSEGPNTVAERLRVARKRLKLSQSDMADRCGVGRTTQHSYETGQSTPDAHYLAKASQIGADVIWVITGSIDASAQHQSQSQRQESNYSGLGEQEAALVDHFRQLNDKAQKHVCWLVADIAELTVGPRPDV